LRQFAEKSLDGYKGTPIEWRVKIETAGSRGSDHKEPHPTEDLIAAAKAVIPGLTADERSYARLELAEFYRRYQEHFAKTEAEKESFHEAAKRERRKIIEENPQWVHLGLVVQFEVSDMVRRGEYNEVKQLLEQYEKLLRKDYRYWVGWADLAFAMAHRDDWLMPAKEIAEKVIREFPDSVPAEIAQQALSQIGDEIGRVIGPMKPLVPPVTPAPAQAKPGAEIAAKPAKPAPAPVTAAPVPRQAASQPAKPAPEGRPVLLIAVIGGAVIIGGAGLLLWLRRRRA
jgi:fructose-specific phosphotransferase system component IIB